MKKRVLISVSDKAGIVDFATEIVKAGYEIISTGGTYDVLKKAGLDVINISEITNFPECLDGRVKTLHPAVHAGLLARRSIKEHMNQLKELNINTIDMVVVNLYPFKKTIMKENIDFQDAIENIDIGGPTMLRSAAKNYQDVTVVVDPEDYKTVLTEIKDKGNTTLETRFYLMYKVFQHTATYDTLIATYLRDKNDIQFPNQITMAYSLVQTMRYGENPNQKAAFYKEEMPLAGSLCQAQQLHGKELSYNNINDTNGALDLLKEFTENPTIVAVKHSNPCGVAEGKTIFEAFKRAYAADPVSIFGGIIASNREIDKETAEEISKIFIEIIVAPGFTDEALEILQRKQNIRLLKLDNITAARDEKSFDMKRIYGGILLQEYDDSVMEGENYVVTKKEPSLEMFDDMVFGMKVVKHVKSNAIVIVKDGQTLGIGAGQVNRIWATKQAIEHAMEFGFNDLSGAVLASDAFFPFDDCVSAAGEAGIQGIVQPGGSKNDEDSIKKADELGIAMLFTGERHFKH